MRIYHCGPTVYKRQHIGNMRRFLFADLLRRTVEFFGYEVMEVTNITDVGHLTQDDIEAGVDKLEKEAAQINITPQEIARRETKQFLDDMESLNIQRSHEYPSATKHIKEMHKLIQKLIDKSYAYNTDAGVFFDITKFDNYGALSGNTIDELEDGARVAVRAEKKNPGDFALWLTDNSEQLQQWDSPWGRGYPGWHIECSAMSLKYLGEEIDIHTGGEDNKFPHHENEIAQSEAATGRKFVRIWMHNAHLKFDGKKLAKREGEQISLDTLCDKGYDPIVFRWLVLTSHYRSKVDFTWDKMSEARTNLDAIKSVLKELDDAGIILKNESEDNIEDKVINSFKAALADDLNTPKALAVVYEYIRHANKTMQKAATSSEAKSPTSELKDEYARIYATLRELDKVLGVMDELENELNADKVPLEVKELGKRRDAARLEKDYKESDALKAEINKLGWEVEDTALAARYKKNRAKNK